jgi:hypothetical protein
MTQRSKKELDACRHKIDRDELPVLSALGKYTREPGKGRFANLWMEPESFSGPFADHGHNARQQCAAGD